MCAPWFAVIAVALCCISFVHADSTTVTSAASTELKNNSSTIAPSTATNDLKTTTHADIATTLQQRQCSAHQDCDSGSYCDVGYRKLAGFCILELSKLARIYRVCIVRSGL
eukprot:m.58184 g.58184  ORF g.58184 m.58184 type:complete len:111 (-) comp11664_c0_seq1:59-391(-)